MTELERLQREINGKVVEWDSEGWGVKLDAILIWPPHGDQISVKPYGYTPEELLKIFTDTKKSPTPISIETYSDVSFCFAANEEISERDGEEMEIIERIADIPNGGVYNMRLLTGQSQSGLPSCPYG